MTTTNLKSQLELEFCPLMRKQTCFPDDENVENYCCLNYQECEKYLEYKNQRKIKK